jgi:hypothetical protein
LRDCRRIQQGALLRDQRRGADHDPHRGDGEMAENAMHANLPREGDGYNWASATERVRDDGATT